LSIHTINFLLFLSPFFNLHSQEFSKRSEDHPLYVVEDSAMYTYEMIVDDLAFLHVNFETFLHPVSVGKSEFGLQMSTVRIGGPIPKKNSVFFVGNIHAREDYSSKFVMKFLNIFLLNLIDEDNTYPHAKKILDSIDIYFMPVANPDGLKIAHQDFIGIEDSFNLQCDQIKLVETFEEWKANGRGIDLNSSFDDGNHEVKKGGAYQCEPCSEGFKGVCPGTSIETQNLQHFVNVLKPLITASFHTKGDVTFWADRGTYKKFKGIDKKINDLICLSSNFEKSNISKNPKDYGCGLENYIRARLHLLATCVELSPGHNGRVQHPDSEFNKYVWNKAKIIPYIYLQQAIKYSKKIRIIEQENLKSQ
jgi:g-D-glutamyl-meso-diaminopimelate peptidase